MPAGDSRLVYSTDGGRVPGKLQPPTRTRASPPHRPPVDGVVRIHRDRKGRGGKTGTAVTGLPGTEAQLDALLKRLKAKYGTGGSREGRDLVFQGDLRERLQVDLEALGHQVKLAGG